MRGLVQSYDDGTRSPLPCTGLNNQNQIPLGHSCPRGSILRCQMLIPEGSTKCYKEQPPKPHKAAENPRPAPAAGCTGIRRGDTNKARAASPPARGSGWPGGALTLPQKPPGSGRWLGLAAGTATLPSSLRPGEQASCEQGQRPGAIPPAGSPGRAGRRPGLLHCRWKRLLASVAAAAAGSGGWGPRPGPEERAPRSVRASVAGARPSVCAGEAGARLCRGRVSV